jgi:threonine dehydrogenase-like Zn-dependent dehydrogenase
MRAACWEGKRKVRVENVPDPRILNSRDAIVRVSSTAICGSDLHLYNGFVPTMEKGDILGHEFMGEVVEVGRAVKNLAVGDRVVVPFPIACGSCAMCQRDLFSLCENSNPNSWLASKLWGHSPCGIFGYSHLTGGYAGGQAEYARVPFADVGPLKVPDGMPDEQVLFLSDIFPTGYMGAEMCDITPGDVIAVWGAGPVGQFAIASALLKGAGRVFAVDCVASRLEMARDQGAEAIDFNREDPVEVLQRMTGGIGPDRAIDAVGLDAMAPSAGPAAKQAKQQRAEFRKELKELEPEANLRGKQWRAGDAPSQVLQWAVESLAKAGTLSIVGLYPEGRLFPIGEALDKNLTIKAGNTPHRKYIPELVDLVESGVIDPAEVLTQTEPLTDAIEAYKAFDLRQPGWVKVELKPTPKERKAA